MRASLLLFLFLLPAVSQAGGPLVISRDLPGWEISDPDFYSAKELYGYINGGAELYLEYGFRQVTAQRCSKGSQELQVDVYEMVSSEAAFGMFSILRGSCENTLKDAEWSCLKPEQILFARDRYLVSVVPYDRKESTRAAAQDAAYALLQRIGKKDHRPNELFRTGPLSPGRSRTMYLHGPLALQSGLDGWTEPMSGIERFDMEYTVFGTKKNRTEAAIIRFRSRRDSEQFLKAKGVQDALSTRGWLYDEKRSLAVMVKGEKTVYVLEGGQAGKLRHRIK